MGLRTIKPLIFWLSYLISYQFMQGPESDELAAASRLEDDVNFYQTVNSDVAKLFHIDPNVKRPALILLKKEDEKLNHFGLFTFFCFFFSISFG